MASPAARVGTVISDKYRIEDVAGRGGVGVVYRARHEFTGATVALKVLSSQYVNDGGALERLTREARAVTAIRHPNVVQILDMGRAPDGMLYVVYEFLEGRTLRARIEEGPLGPTETLRTLAPVMDGLDLAHRKGIVHRDLKPDNLMLSTDARGGVVPKVLDFGIAKVLDEGQKTMGPSITTFGEVIGTPPYMPPEQAMGEARLGPPTDVWAMGILFYECLTGTLPYRSRGIAPVLHEILHGPAPSVAAVGTPLPAPVAQAVDGALAKDRTARYGEMGSFLDAVLEAASAAGITDPDLEHLLQTRRQERPGAPVAGRAARTGIEETKIPSVSSGIREAAAPGRAGPPPGGLPTTVPPSAQATPYPTSTGPGSTGAQAIDPHPTAAPESGGSGFAADEPSSSGIGAAPQRLRRRRGRDGADATGAYPADLAEGAGDEDEPVSVPGLGGPGSGRRWLLPAGALAAAALVAGVAGWAVVNAGDDGVERDPTKAGAGPGTQRDPNRDPEVAAGQGPGGEPGGPIPTPVQVDLNEAEVFGGSEDQDQEPAGDEKAEDRPLTEEEARQRRWDEAARRRRHEERARERERLRREQQQQADDDGNDTIGDELLSADQIFGD